MEMLRGSGRRNDELVQVYIVMGREWGESLTRRIMLNGERVWRGDCGVAIESVAWCWSD